MSNLDYFKNKEAIIGTAQKFNNMVHILVSGNSMLPILKDGDEIPAFGASYYYPGDIIVFKYKTGYIIHRLLKITDGRYFAKGDNSYRIEDFSLDEIIGKVIIPNDLNNSKEFLTASWNIGKMFRALGYDVEKLTATTEYKCYRTKYIDNVHLSLQYMKKRSQAFIKSLPDLSEFPYSLIKGESLSVQALGKPGLRMSCDVDLLISKNNINEIGRCFNDFGFKPTSSDRFVKVTMEALSHQSVPLFKSVGPYGNCCVDLNHDLFWGEYEGSRIDIDDFISDSIEMELYGCCIKVLTPLKAFIQIALHHYKDMNSIFLLATRKNRWKEELSELYCLFKRNQAAIPLTLLYEKCSRYEVKEYIYFILYSIYQLFPDEVIMNYMESFKNEKGVALIDSYGLSQQEQKRWKCDFKTRLDSDFLYPLIEQDLSEKDKEKIAFNNIIFRNNE